eukprot:c2566_g1_i1 orf=3-221(-)
MMLNTTGNVGKRAPFPQGKLSKTFCDIYSLCVHPEEFELIIGPLQESFFDIQHLSPEVFSKKHLHTSSGFKVI